MKKKLAALIIALSCALTCTSALSACSNTVPDNPPDTGKTDDTDNPPDTDTADNTETQSNITGEYEFVSTSYLDYETEQYITVNVGDVIEGTAITEDFITLSVKSDFKLTINLLVTDEKEETSVLSETTDWAYFKDAYIVMSNNNSSMFRRNHIMTYGDSVLTINFEEVGLGTLSLRQVEKGEAATIPFKYPAKAQTPTIPEGVQLQDVSEDDTGSVIYNFLNKICESENANVYCVAKFTDYGNFSYNDLNTIISTAGYIAADGYSAFYDYAYNSERKRYDNGDRSYMQNYVSGNYALEHNGKLYGLASNIKFNSKEANSTNTLNKYFYSEGIEIDIVGAYIWKNISELLAQRFSYLPSFDINPVWHFANYSSIYNPDNYDFSYLLRNYPNAVKAAVKANENKLFISYIVTVPKEFEFELTFYADAAANLTVDDVEKQISENFEGFSELSAEDIITEYSDKFPHANFDRQALTEKIKAKEKIEVSVTGKHDFSPENLIIVGDNKLYFNTEYLEYCKTIAALNTLEDGKIIIDTGSKISILPEYDVTIGEYLENRNIISIYVDDVDESEQSIYLYAYNLG